MKLLLLGYVISISSMARTQSILIPKADIDAEKNLTKDFVAFDSNYTRERIEVGTQARSLFETVFALEKQGVNTSCMHQVLFEAGSLILSSADFKKIHSRLDELKQMIAHRDNLPDANAQDTDGSYGRCYNEWYLKVDKSYDQIEKNALKNGLPKPLPQYLDRINTPPKLEMYLTSVSISNVSKTGLDNEREFNDILATLMQMILRGRPENYLVDSSLKNTLLRLVLYKFRNPETGWWGEKYVRNGDTDFVDNLSVTFHTISYLDGKVSSMNKVISTILAVKAIPYPTGWLWNGQYWNHNNMDIVALFKFGWQQASEEQRNKMSKEIDSMLHWCLTRSLQSDGSFKAIPADGSVEEAQYYGVSFLARIGYFDKSKRFWTNRNFPEASAVREKLIAYIKANYDKGGSGGDYYKSALEDLNAKR